MLFMAAWSMPSTNRPGTRDNNIINNQMLGVGHALTMASGNSQFRSLAAAALNHQSSLENSLTPSARERR
jgi:hypothetical protein